MIFGQGFLPLALDKSISNCRAAGLVLVQPGYFISPVRRWMQGVKAAVTTRNLDPNQWRNREEWRLVSTRRRQLLKCWRDR